MKKNFIQHKNNKGFTLLFAVLVATLVVSIGATIISIALRQTILSGTSRESQYAFYAANTAMECAKYWDTTTRADLDNKKVFALLNGEEEITSSEGITCSGSNIIDGYDSNTQMISEDIGGGKKWTFFIKINNTATDIIAKDFNYEYCAQVVLTKTDTGTITTTIIEAKGYNTCDESNPRRVERGLIEEYQS